MDIQPLEETFLTAKPGTVLVTENEVSRKMFIIREGKARVFKNYLGQRVTLAILGSGEIFGELSFLDAEPRSASVEALTELKFSVVDGEKASEQIRTLPPWVMPIFRSVFHRFREADQKITVLQSMNEYQKKTFKSDSFAQAIYMELLRFIRTLELLCANQLQTQGHTEIMKSEVIYQEMDEVLGKRIIGLRVFWRLLKEHDFIDHALEETQGKLKIRAQPLKDWNEYLHAESTSERYLFLSHTSVAILRRLVTFIDSGSRAPEPGALSTAKKVEVTHDEVRLAKIPFYGEAIAELESAGLIVTQKSSFIVDPREIHQVYVYQSILKSFDHTMANVE